MTLFVPRLWVVTAMVLASCKPLVSRPDITVEDAGEQPFTVEPPVTLGWDDQTAAVGLAGVDSTCLTVSFGDMDGDGAPDLLLPGGGALRIFRNDGAGHFTPWSSTPIPSSTRICAMAIADLDDDGRRDVVVSVDHRDDFTTGVCVLFNDGNGAFTHVEGQRPQPALARADGGRADLSVFSVGVVQSAGQPTLLFLANELDGAAGAVSPSTCALDSRGINVECRTPIGAPSSTAFRIPPGRRTLEPVVGLDLQGNAQGLGVSDFDRDGRDDLLIAFDFLPQGALRGAEGGLEEVSTRWGVNQFAHGMGVALGDVDEDGVTDAVFSTIGGFVDFKGLGPAGFQARGDRSPYQAVPRSIWPWSTLFADLDANGHLDLLATNEFASTSRDSLRWVRGLGGPNDFVGAFSTVVFKNSTTSYWEGQLPYAAMLEGRARPKSAALADIDGDGRVELAMLLKREQGPSADLVLGRVTGAVAGHGLTVRLGARAGQGTRVELTCGGRTQVVELFGAEGMGVAARTEAHFGCGALTTYERLRVEPRGRPAIELPGGPLDRAVFVEVP